MPSQSATYSSDKLNNYLFSKKYYPSTFPTVENTQHVPTDPWSLTPVTAPFSRQSHSSGISFRLCIVSFIFFSKYLSGGNYVGSLGGIKYLS